MTCYHRHLRDLFETLDVDYEAEGRRRVHAAILEVLHLPGDSHCPQVWAALKEIYGPVPEQSDELARDVGSLLAAS